MKRILVPTDFSAAARNALKVAVEIAKKTKAELFVVNVMDMPSYLYSGITGVGSPESLKEFVNEIKKEAFDNLKEQIESVHYDIVTPILDSGIIVDSIVNIAKDKEVDLIVMGTTGSSGLAEWVLGSNAEKVVRFSPCPVLSLNEEHKEFKLKDIVFACDFANEKYDNLDSFQRLANAFDAKIHLVKIHTPQYFEHTDIMHAKILKFARDNDLMNYTINQFNHVKIPEGIFAFVKSVNAGMVAMATHRRKGISHLFMGSQAEDIVNRSKMPIFTFRVTK